MDTFPVAPRTATQGARMKIATRMTGGYLFVLQWPLARGTTKGKRKDGYRHGRSRLPAIGCL